jgi:hypothetical protein
MAGNLFDVPWSEIAMLNHEVQHSFCRIMKLDRQELKDEGYSKVYEPLNYDEDGEPFLCRARGPRATSLCNYPIHAQQVFTIHDLQADESSGVWAASPFQFYSGAPMFINGYIVGTL